MDTAIAVLNLRLRDLLDPLLEVGLFGTLATIVVAGLFRLEHTAGPPDADLPVGPRTVLFYTAVAQLEESVSHSVTPFGECFRVPIFSGRYLELAAD